MFLDRTPLPTGGGGAGNYSNATAKTIAMMGGYHQSYTNTNRMLSHQPHQQQQQQAAQQSVVVHNALNELNNNNNMTALINTNSMDHRNNNMQCNTADATTKGLLNGPGQNNCFLNCAVQVS